MTELETIKIILDLGMAAVFGWLFMMERKRVDILQEKIYSQFKVQGDIEKEWLIALSKLTEALEKRREDFVRQSAELQAFAQSIRQQDSEWRLDQTQVKEVLHEIQTAIDALEQAISSTEFTKTIVQAYIEERRKPAT